MCVAASLLHTDKIYKTSSVERAFVSLPADHLKLKQVINAILPEVAGAHAADAAHLNNPLHGAIVVVVLKLICEIPQFGVINSSLNK